MAHQYECDDRGQPSRDEVRAELDTILAGRAFEHAGRAQEFLRFVVMETLAGRDHRLKGYTIALDVFGRAADFDAQSDPLVRVEAGRLRHRLLEHYQGDGRSSRLRIDLPRGCYVPRFLYAPAVPQPKIAAPRTLRPVLGGAAALGLALWAVVAHNDGAFAPPGPAAPVAARGALRVAAAAAGPKLLVLPFSNLSGNRDLDYFAFGMTEEVTVRLGSFNVVVLADTTRVANGNEDPDLEAVRAKFGADYVLTGSVRHAGDTVRVAARLVDVENGAQLWAEAFDARLDVEHLLGIEERLAEQVASTIGVPYGPLFEREIVRTGAKAAEQLATYDCVLRFHYYAATLDPARHAEALHCFKRAVVQEPRSADAWAGLSLVYLAEHAHGYNREPGDPIERAREAASIALDIDGNNRLANRAMLNVRFATRDFEGLDAVASHVLELAPNDPNTLGYTGTLLAFGGQRERGIALIDRALELSSNPPASFYVAHVFCEIENGNYKHALAWARKMDAPSWFMAPMLAAASAGLAGHVDSARSSAARLLELYPDFPAHARAELAKWYLDETLTETTVAGLRAAGVDVP
jgi:adenylate cyclase